MTKSEAGISESAIVHPTAIIDEGAAVMAGVRIWHFAHVRDHAHIGADSVIGKGAYIGAGVEVGSRCKVQNGAQLFDPCTLDDGVFIGPGAILTNDRLPRAVTPSGALRRGGEWKREGTRVAQGASVGAAVVVLGGVQIGEWAMIGAASVVTQDVPPYQLAVGSPARLIHAVCRCGNAARDDGDGGTMLRAYDSEPTRRWCDACWARESGHVIAEADGQD